MSNRIKFFDILNYILLTAIVIIAFMIIKISYFDEMVDAILTCHREVFTVSELGDNDVTFMLNDNYSINVEVDSIDRYHIGDESEFYTNTNKAIVTVDIETYYNIVCRKYLLVILILWVSLFISYTVSAYTISDKSMTFVSISVLIFLILMISLCVSFEITKGTMRP